MKHTKQCQFHYTKSTPCNICTKKNVCTLGGAK
jgi:hypothetical protein